MNSSLLKKFIEVYNLPYNLVFKRIELEDALIEKFGDLQYNKYQDSFTKNSPARYFVGCKDSWGLNDISTSQVSNNPEEALISLFIKYGVEPVEDTEEYYVQNFTKEFHDIIHEVYDS